MILEFFLFIATILFSLYFYIQRKFKYWKNLDVPYIEPKFPFGNMQGFRRKYHTSEIFPKFYSELKKKSNVGFGGIYFFSNPVVLPTDLKFLKHILVKDFQYFHDRGLFYNEESDPLSAHLVALEGDNWKFVREKMTPTFTSGKMRTMFPTIMEIAERLTDVLTKTIEQNQQQEAKSFLSRFTTDIIGSCAFGIDCNCLNNPDAEFLKMGSMAFMPRNSILQRLLTIAFPNLAKKLRLRVVKDEVSEFFLRVFQDVVKYREENKIQKNDFLNLLIQLKNEGKVEGDTGTNKKLSFNQIAAEAFVFFIAGYETSSTTLAFCLHELAMNQEIQEKLRQNILAVTEKYNGKITYEGLSEMPYLEMCINETLRKYPPGSNLIRKATKNYQVPDTNIVLEKGTTVFISLYAIHHDPEYFPDPEVFDPERFSPEEIEKRNSLPLNPFLPFGEGPRSCVGSRFGLLEAKIGLATLLSSFKFSKSEKSTHPLKFSKNSLVLSPEGGLFLKIEKL